MSQTSWRTLAAVILTAIASLGLATLAEPAAATVTCPGSNTDFTGQTFNSVDWQGCDLSSDTFTSAVFTGTNNLEYTTLVSTNFQSANLTGTDFNNADINSNVNFDYANMTSVSLVSDDLVWGDFTFVDANLTDATIDSNFSNLDWPTDFTGANFTNANLSGSNFSSSASGPPPNQTIFNDAIFTGTNISGAVLTPGVTMKDLVSDGGISDNPPAALPTSWQVVGGFIMGPSANLAGDNLSNLGTISGQGLALTGATLTNANLTNTVFGTLQYPLDLSNATLTSVTLTGTDLSNSYLWNVKSGFTTGAPTALPAGWVIIPSYYNGGYIAGPGLNSSTQPGANLSGANLTLTDANGPFHQGVNLSYETLSGASIGWATFANDTFTGIESGGLSGGAGNLPSSFTDIDNYFVGPAANLSGAILNNHVNFTGLNLDYANLTNANLKGAKLGCSSPCAPATLLDTSLYSANLASVTLTRADLSTANLQEVTSGGITGCPALPGSWACYEGYLVGPYASDSNATFTNNPPLSLPPAWDLDHIHLSADDLTGWVVSQGANLTGASFKTANLAGADFGADYVNGSWTAGDNFTNVDATGAAFTNATNFEYDNFTNANFDGATGMASANTANVVWNHTTCPDNSNSDGHGNTCVGHM